MLARLACGAPLAVLLLACSPAIALCQTPEPVPAPLTADSYTPISGMQRIDWIVEGTVGKKSLLVVGPLATVWQTGWNNPEEWGRGIDGIAKRYAEREVDVAISNSIEAGVGALWGEEPRYVRSGRRGIWPRARYAMKTVFLTQRRDGSLDVAWGRIAGNTVNNVIENAWLPPSVSTAGQTAWRSALGFLGRLAGNAWEEFWPDVVRHFHR